MARRRDARPGLDTPAPYRSAERPNRIESSGAASLPPAPAPAIAPADDELAEAPAAEAPFAGEAPSRPEAARLGRAPRPSVTAAAYLTSPPPPYPAASRRAGEEGTVTLRVRVDRDGSPASVAVEASSGSSRLDEAAEQAVRQWRFRPARRGAEPVESWMRVPVIFRLKEAS